jgi:uncharacterized membrane protein YraQ (UPF0718 family)
MTLLWLATGAALLVSLIADRGKTRVAVVKGLKMLGSIGPLLLGVLAVVSLVLACTTPEMLQRALSGAGPLPFFIALGIGSVALVPGFIAYPLAGMLRQNGASVSVLAAFITGLMMVGVLTLPVEARFFGWRMSLIRNALALAGSLAVAAIVGWMLT